MPRPIKLLIQRKTLVPTKRNIVHAFRSDWKKVYILEYEQTPLLFNYIAGVGPIKTDAQFAKWIKDNFGVGDYYIIGFRKGRQGLWPFLRITCEAESFHIVQKKETAEQKELREGRSEYRRINRQLKQAESDEEREEIKERVNDVLEDYELSKEIVELTEENVKRGPAPYLKQTIPLYRDYPYEDYSNNPNNTNQEPSSSAPAQRWI